MKGPLIDVYKQMAKYIHDMFVVTLLAIAILEKQHILDYQGKSVNMADLGSTDFKDMRPFLINNELPAFILLFILCQELPTLTVEISIILQ